jgi:hypothetical protein
VKTAISPRPKLPIRGTNHRNRVDMAREKLGTAVVPPYSVRRKQIQDVHLNGGKERHCRGWVGPTASVSAA